MTKIFKAVPITERLPPKWKWVTLLDEQGHHRVYRLTDYGWQMRDLDGTYSPSNNLPTTHWLEEEEEKVLQLEGINQPDFAIIFTNPAQNNHEVGRFWVQDGRLMFEGNVNESGRIFVDYIARLLTK